MWPSLRYAVIWLKPSTRYAVIYGHLLLRYNDLMTAVRPHDGRSPSDSEARSAECNDLWVPSAYCLVPSYFAAYSLIRLMLAPTPLSFSSSRS